MLGRLTVLVGICAIGAGASAGCSGSTTGGGGAQPIPADQFVSRYVGAVCDNVGGCCQNAGLAYDAQGCKTAGTAEFGSQFKPDQPGTVYDPDAAGTCVAAIQHAAETCTAFDVEGASACEAIFKGTLAPGETCTSSMQCAAPPGGDARCDIPLDAPSGTCVAQTRGKLGEACAGTCVEHSDGSVDCSSSSSTSGTAICYTNDGFYCDQTCKPVIALGQPCEVDGCAAGAFCSGGFCTAYPGSGQPCGDSYLCADGLYCDMATTCQPLLANGAACESGDQCQSSHCANGACGADNFVTPEICSGSTA